MTKQLLAEVISYFHGDPKRIHHLVKVHALAKYIGECEQLDTYTQYILETVAIVHDMGILPCEVKYGSAPGHLQEKEGVAPVEALLEHLGYAPQVKERVLYLVAHHHTYTNVSGLDYRILLEADALVNFYEEEVPRELIRSYKEKLFRTNTGLMLLEMLYEA